MRSVIGNTIPSFVVAASLSIPSIRIFESLIQSIQSTAEFCYAIWETDICSTVRSSYQDRSDRSLDFFRNIFDSRPGHQLNFQIDLFSHPHPASDLSSLSSLVCLSFFFSLKCTSQTVNSQNLTTIDNFSSSLEKFGPNVPHCSSAIHAYHRIFLWAYIAVFLTSHTHHLDIFSIVYSKINVIIIFQWRLPKLYQYAHKVKAIWRSDSWSCQCLQKS